MAPTNQPTDAALNQTHPLLRFVEGSTWNLIIIIVVGRRSLAVYVKSSLRLHK